MSSENIPKTRPYWHVDAKWVAGLMLAVMLNVTLDALRAGAVYG